MPLRWLRPTLTDRRRTASLTGWRGRNRNTGSSRFHGLPQLDAVSLGVAQLGEATVRITLRIDRDLFAGRPQLIDHRFEVGDAEVDHPRVLGRPNHLRVQRKGGERGVALLLAPRALA